MQKFVSRLTAVILIGYAFGYVSLSHAAANTGPKNENATESIRRLEKTSRLNEVAHLIKYYDEVLTQSARNYAFTQDKKWLQRYQEIGPKLDATVKEALEKGDRVDKAFLKKIDTANLKLVEMEYRSIELVNNGQRQQALDILESGQYGKQKEIYLQSLEDYVQRRSEQTRMSILATRKEYPIISLTNEEEAWLSEHPIIRLGFNPDMEPLVIVGGDGSLSGFHIEVFEMLQEILGVKIEFDIDKWPKVIEKAKKKEIDGMTATAPVLAKALGMPQTKPYYHTYISAFARKDRAININTPEDLEGLTIVHLKGVKFIESMLKPLRDKCSIIEAGSTLEVFTLIQDGKADVALGFNHDNYLLKKYVIPGVRPIFSFLNNQVAIGATLRDDWPQLVSILNKGIDALGEDKINNILAKWTELPTLIKLSTFTEQEKTWLKAHPVIRVHNEEDWPPFNFAKDGKPQGLSIDYMNLLAERLGVRVEYITGPTWNEFLGMLKAKELDVMLNIVKTEERKEYILYTPPYARNPNVIVSLVDGTPYENAEQLNGKTVASPKGFYQNEVLRQNFPEINRMPTKDTLESLKAVMYGKADATIVEVAVAKDIIARNMLTGLRLSGEFGFGDPSLANLNIGVRDDWPLLQSSLIKAMDSVTPEEMNLIRQKWMKGGVESEEPGALSAEEASWLAEHKIMRLGVDPSWAPIEYFDSREELAGITSDYVKILNEKFGSSIEPVKGLTWEGVLDAARNGKIDVISAIAKTDKRAEYLLFTKPYLKLPMVVVTRDDAPFIDGIDDLEGKTIAVASGYVILDILQRDYPDQELLQVNSLAEGLLAVSEGRAHAVIENMASIRLAEKEQGLTNLKMAATTPYSYDLSYGVRKDWPELVPILEKSIDAIPVREKALIKDKWVNIQIERQTDWQLVWKIVLGFIFVGGIILTVIAIWNRRLTREVDERKRAEERFQSIAAATPGAIIQLQFNSEGNPEYLYLSAKAEEFYGIPPEQVIQGKKRLQWYHEDKERIHEEIRSISSAGEDLNLVGRIEPSGGAIKWIRINASPSRSAEGEFTYSGFILDITERKLAEQEYLKSERKIKAMSQAAEDAMVMIDGQGRVLFWNPAAERLFGYSEAEAMGMDFHRMAAPDEYHDKIYNGLDHFSGTGEGAVLGTTTEISARNRKGYEFPVEVTISSFQVDDEWFAVGTVRDITARKEAEDQLKLTQNTVDKAAQSIFWIDPETGRFTYVNEAACESLGYTKDEFLGMSVPDIDAEFSAEKLGGLIQSLKEHFHIETEGVHRAKDGRLLNVMLSIVLTQYQNHQIIGIYAKDITELKEAELELKERLEELEKFSRLVVGREEKMIGLKEEINELLIQSGKGEKYKIVQ